MKCKYKENCGYEFCLDDCCPEFEAAVETHADQIRAMSDEELAYWVMCPYDDPPCGGEPDGTVFNCMDCTLKWLKQPAEVSGDA